MGITHVYAALEEDRGIPTLAQFGADADRVSTQDGEWQVVDSEECAVTDDITGITNTATRDILGWSGSWFVVYGKPADGEQTMRTLAILQKQSGGGYIIEGDEKLLSAIPEAKPVEEQDYTAESEIARRKIGTIATWDSVAVTAKIETCLSTADKLAVETALAPALPEKRIR